MKIHEIIAKLQLFNQDLEVGVLLKNNYSKDDINPTTEKLYDIKLSDTDRRVIFIFKIPFGENAQSMLGEKK